MNEGMKDFTNPYVGLCSISYILHSFLLLSWSSAVALMSKCKKVSGIYVSFR